MEPKGQLLQADFMKAQVLPFRNHYQLLLESSSSTQQEKKIPSFQGREIRFPPLPSEHEHNSRNQRK